LTSLSQEKAEQFDFKSFKNKTLKNVLEKLAFKNFNVLSTDELTKVVIFI